MKPLGRPLIGCASVWPLTNGARKPYSLTGIAAEVLEFTRARLVSMDEGAQGSNPCVATATLQRRYHFAHWRRRPLQGSRDTSTPHRHRRKDDSCHRRPRLAHHCAHVASG